MPSMLALPSPRALFARADPEEEQETSYLALSVKILSRVASIIASSPGDVLQEYYSAAAFKSQTFVRVLCEEDGGIFARQNKISLAFHIAVVV